MNRLDSELVELFGEYAPIFFQKGPWKEFPQMRTIPIHEAISITTEVMPYENAEAILRSKTLIAVRNCVCRQEHRLSGNGCNSILESCLSFDGAAKNTVETGKGRFIGLDEALSILEKAKKDALVLQPANSKNPIYLCACCKCCCGVLTQIKKHPEPGNLVSNPYYATHDPELCLSCGTCIEVCPMEVLTMDNQDKVVFNQLRCIGCGLCVTVCPSQSVKIIRKPVSIQPRMPKNTLDTYLKLAFKRKSWKVFDVISLVIKSFVDRMIAPR